MPMRGSGGLASREGGVEVRYEGEECYAPSWSGVGLARDERLGGGMFPICATER